MTSSSAMSSTYKCRKGLFFLPPAMLLRLKMALSAVKSVSRCNTSGGRGGGVNHLAWVPRQVSQGLLWTTLAERVWINWGVLKEFAWKRWQPWQPGWTGVCSCITPMCVQANEDTERGSVCSCPHYTSVCLDVTKDQNCISTVTCTDVTNPVFCLSLTGIQSKPRNSLPGSLILLNTCTDMQIQTHRYTCTISRWQTFAKHYAASVHCISLSKCWEPMNQLQLASLTWDLSVCGLGPGTISYRYRIAVCLFPFFYSQIFKKKMYLRRVFFFLTVCPIFPAQVFWARWES